MTLPFKQKDIYLGLAEISGLLRIEGDSLEIEYKVNDTTLGFLDSSVKSCHIPLRIIDSIEVEKKLFSAKFELTFNRIPDLGNPFQLEGNSLTFSVKKKDLERARSFRSSLMFRLLDREVEQMEIQEKESEESAKPRPVTPPRPHRKPKDGSGGLENMLRDE